MHLLQCSYAKQRTLKSLLLFVLPKNVGWLSCEACQQQHIASETPQVSAARCQRRAQATVTFLLFTVSTSTATCSFQVSLWNGSSAGVYMYHLHGEVPWHDCHSNLCWYKVCLYMYMYAAPVTSTTPKTTPLITPCILALCLLQPVGSLKCLAPGRQQ